MIDKAIAAIAATQLGNITRRQLLELGLSQRAIDYRLKIGLLHRLYRGVYAVGRPPTDPLQWAAAAVLACGDRAMLSHSSAMTLWGLWKRWDRPFDVTVAGDRRLKDVRIHYATNLLKRDVRTEGGVRVTSPARTLLDQAPTLRPRSLNRAVNNARHAKILELEELADVAARFPRHPGAKIISPFAGVKGGPTRSGWEDDFPGFCEHYGLPEPTMSTDVAGHEVDALFPDEKVIVELDSWDFHWSKQSFEDDRDRDADTAAADHITVRVTGERLDRRPRREADRLQQILSRRRRLFG
jgi:Transcriptional regulator, AbiEi antitoxin